MCVLLFIFATDDDLFVWQQKQLKVHLGNILKSEAQLHAAMVDLEASTREAMVMAVDEEQNNPYLYGGALNSATKTRKRIEDDHARLSSVKQANTKSAAKSWAAPAVSPTPTDSTNTEAPIHNNTYSYYFGQRDNKNNKARRTLEFDDAASDTAMDGSHQKLSLEHLKPNPSVKEQRSRAARLNNGHNNNNNNTKRRQSAKLSRG